MSIKPIDLQTMFAQINHVGKDQAFQKEAMLMQQASTARELVDKTHISDETVNETKASSDGPEDINGDEKPESGKNRNHKKRKKDEQKEKPEKKYFRDPDLGSRIDIEG